MELVARDPGAAFHGSDVGRRLLDLVEERLALMDETGLDMQLLFLTTPALPDVGPESIKLARRTNDAAATDVSQHSAHFKALATLPVAMPEAVAAELQR